MAAPKFKVATEKGRALINSDAKKLRFSIIFDGAPVEFYGTLVREPKGNAEGITYKVNFTQAPQEFSLRTGRYTILYTYSDQSVTFFRD